jgi:hypothetical protein
MLFMCLNLAQEIKVTTSSNIQQNQKYPLTENLKFYDSDVK